MWINSRPLLLQILDLDPGSNFSSSCIRYFLYYGSVMLFSSEYADAWLDLD